MRYEPALIARIIAYVRARKVNEHRQLVIITAGEVVPEPLAGGSGSRGDCGRLGGSVRARRAVWDQALSKDALDCVAVWSYRSDVSQALLCTAQPDLDNESLVIYDTH